MNIRQGLKTPNGSSHPADIIPHLKCHSFIAPHPHRPKSQPTPKQLTLYPSVPFTGSLHVITGTNKADILVK